MKRVIISLLAVLLVFASQAQNTPNPNVQKLTVTSSPAFVLLGVQPDNIQRPSTPRDFIGAIQSAVVNQQLQPNFSMETNPWNWKKNQYSNQFYLNDYFYKRSEAVKRNFAFSVATSTSDTTVFGKLKQGLGLGYGIRLILVSGRVNKPVAEKVAEWENLEVKSIFLDNLLPDRLIGFDKAKAEQFARLLIAGIKEGKYVQVHAATRDTLAFLPEDIAIQVATVNAMLAKYEALDPGQFKATLDQDRIQVNNLKNANISAINALNQKTTPFAREGFMLELDAAGVTVFQASHWEDAHFGKAALWLSPSYRFNLNKEASNTWLKSLDWLGVIRYIWNDPMVEKGNYLDVGMKLQLNSGAWTASLEGVSRYATQVPENIHSSWTYSWLATMSYTLVQSVTLKFSFGSNFNGNTTTYTAPKDMFAVAGINIGIF